jgi:hypothetical protein
MDPASLLALQSIVAGNGKKSLKLDFPLTEEQHALRIPLELILLAGIVHQTSATNNTYTALLFDRLLQESEIRPRVRWSPTLVPSNAAQKIITALMVQRQRELEASAHKAARCLVETQELEQQQQQQRLTKINKKAKRKKNSGSTIHCNVVLSKSRDDKSETSHESDSDQESLTDESEENWIPAPPTRLLSKLDIDAQDWVTVGGKKKATMNSNNEPCSTEGAPTDELLLPENIKAKEKSPERLQFTAFTHPCTLLTFVDDRECVVSSSDDEGVKLLITAHTTDGRNKPLIATNADDYESVTAQQTTIHHLEVKLAECQETLCKERVLAQQAMTAEKEAANEQMQTLQLRLYINETRLKTFEDALHQHVDAVAQNVATTLSPERGRKSGPSGSPLYCRGLRGGAIAL